MLEYTARSGSSPPPEFLFYEVTVRKSDTPPCAVGGSARFYSGIKPHCIVTVAASTVIFTDRPDPSELMHVTTSGGNIRSRLVRDGPLQTWSTPRGP
jgi:hypothetical protein